MAAGPSLQGEDLDGVPAELTGGTNFDSNRPGPFKKGCLTIPAILAGILLIMWLISDKDEKKASDKERSQTTTVIDEDGKPVSDIHNSAIAPDKEQLAPGEELYTGESGDDIGAIAKDGKSRFLSITGGPGVGVGTGTIAAKSTTWPKSGKITGFGVKLSTSTNKGRYGFNIFIDGTTYSVGCAMEVGETSCFALPENIRRNVPIQKGQSLTIIIGEQGHLEAKGDYKATWWMTFQPS